MSEMKGGGWFEEWEVISEDVYEEVEWGRGVGG